MVEVQNKNKPKLLKIFKWALNSQSSAYLPLNTPRLYIWGFSFFGVGGEPGPPCVAQDFTGQSSPTLNLQGSSASAS